MKLAEILNSRCKLAYHCKAAADADASLSLERGKGESMQMTGTIDDHNLMCFFTVFVVVASVGCSNLSAGLVAAVVAIAQRKRTAASTSTSSKWAV